MIVAAADLPPQNHIVVNEQMPDAIGEEGRLLHEEWLKARDHWQDQISFGRDSDDRLNDDEINCHLFTPEFAIDVVYRFAGKISPIPYDWDD